MVSVRDQYDAYPYPERDPEDERRRLVTGSPSHPAEMDHFLWGGQRDWSGTTRILVAGGGTGDGLIQLAQMLSNAGRACEITYLDLSTSARAIAEKRAAIRGLTSIRFVTGSLLDAPDHGRFDYIDCCGVLHHLPDPEAGFRALADALAPGGGLGFMVYAPHGRSGVYPLQEAFGALLDGPPEARLAAARRIVAKLPAGHPFRRNPHLVDHAKSDAGFYDLLLHSQDRAYSVSELCATLAATGWRLASFTMPGLYDLNRFTEAGADLPPEERMALAEKLDGTIKIHVGYAVPSDTDPRIANGRDLSQVPYLRGAQPRALAQAVAEGKPLNLNLAGETRRLAIPKAAAAALAGIDGRRQLSDILQAGRIDPVAFRSLWAKVEAALLPWGLLAYSGVFRPERG